MHKIKDLQKKCLTLMLKQMRKEDKGRITIGYKWISVFFFKNLKVIEM